MKKIFKKMLTGLGIIFSSATSIVGVAMLCAYAPPAGFIGLGLTFVGAIPLAIIGIKIFTEDFIKNNHTETSEPEYYSYEKSLTKEQEIIKEQTEDRTSQNKKVKEEERNL